jgi:hypothetical protein
VNNYIRFKIQTIEKDGKVRVRIWNENAEVIISYNDVKVISSLIDNLDNLLAGALDEYFINTEFNKKIDDQLDEWLERN